MNGSPKIAVREDARDVRVEGGSLGLLEWLQTQKNQVEAELGRAKQRYGELIRELDRLEELTEMLWIIAKEDKTALIVGKD